MSDSKHIAFLGLGVMGGPMAGHLLRAGHTVTAYNRTPARAQAWRDRFGSDGAAHIAATPAEAARDAQIVISCVGNDDDLSQVMRGPDGALATLAPGGLVIDHTTVSARIARALAQECADGGLHFVDAPVSGGQAGAENGKLAIMCGGTPDAYAAAEAVMAAYAARMVHIGGAGAGQTAKMVNQICISGIMAGLSEAVRFADAANLDMDKVLDAISGGAAQSWQMENRWKTMAADEFDFGFAIDWMRKDLGYAIEEAKALGVSVPVTALVDQFYGEVQALGGGRQDTSALIRRLPKGRR
ncbi:putative 3-hydroxyisobutyrate dehydrogenase [Caenibius tardaugens NBRC 16725]|uniref:Putative 3-hydroxyisobutyrate dehydrogenase n=1 Tax=Caenibius tardaugens NBRC 16725 TaxID=1219035 RepID=U2ZVQ2_9SPHN|nr:NAD(P)-dependent oxidoreductase [Caenibius tardaugens]AZI36773.1 NAD(P)-dependent oxidoreductase [Caenibius tardaugens NBRC 16725]GAD49449.1 putative 3-hydroxyisobutyrate dehydrogenase [Caenibius tardaugens NBRC 16725]